MRLGKTAHGREGTLHLESICYTSRIVCAARSSASVEYVLGEQLELYQRCCYWVRQGKLESLPVDKWLPRANESPIDVRCAYFGSPIIDLIVVFTAAPITLVFSTFVSYLRTSPTLVRPSTLPLMPRH